MNTTFSATVKINNTAIPDFKSFETEERCGISEVSFNVHIDKPVVVTTDDTVSLSFSLGGGAEYSLIDGKKIEIVNKTTQSTMLRGAGSLITRYSPQKKIIFINQTWLSSAYPRYYLRNGILYQQDPGTKPIQYKGSSILRLYIPELPGKDVKDNGLTCIVQPGISYYTIAQYIAKKTGYTLHVTCPNLRVQKTFSIEPHEPYFSALARLYAMFNPMMYIEGSVIHILDVGGDANEKVSGTATIKLSEDSFSVLAYNKVDNQEVVDHCIIYGTSRNWRYNYKSNLSTARIHRSEATLTGETDTLVFESDFSSDTTFGLAVLQKELDRSGIALSAETVFQHTNTNTDKNGRHVRTCEMVFDYLSNDSAVVSEVTETYNVGGDLVHKLEKKNRYADYKTPLGHTIIEFARLGVVQGDVTEVNVGGYKTIIPSSYEFVPISAEVVTYGDFIGETGQQEVDIDQYNKVTYIKDEDTISSGGSETDCYVRSRPQVVTRNSMIGITPSTWETNPDDSSLGWQNGFMLTRRERIRFNRASQYILQKMRMVEEFIPVHSTKVYTEDIPLRKRQIWDEQVTDQWEFFCLGGDPDAIIQWTNDGTLTQPAPGGRGLVPGQPASFHPVYTLQCPDLIDGNMARRVARKIFRKMCYSNTTATIRTVFPFPGVRIGTIFQIPACTKKVFNWNSKVWEDITLSATDMWVVGVKTIVSYEGTPESNYRQAQIYTEFELKENF